MTPCDLNHAPVVAYPRRMRGRMSAGRWAVIAYARLYEPDNEETLTFYKGMPADVRTWVVTGYTDNRNRRVIGTRGALTVLKQIGCVARVLIILR